MAPGVYVIGGWTPKQPIAHLGPLPLYDRYAMNSGKSIAAAHVSGVAALLKCVYVPIMHGVLLPLGLLDLMTGATRMTISNKQEVERARSSKVRLPIVH